MAKPKKTKRSACLYCLIAPPPLHQSTDESKFRSKEVYTKEILSKGVPAKVKCGPLNSPEKIVTECQFIGIHMS
uniref:Uncharacterized protein n=1 Tax=Caenorhabditis japonica TaxID=281687 RepID=A0A8R1IHA5_CAEJA